VTIHRTTTPARAARRQLLVDRFAEYLAEHGAQPENATAYARDLLDVVDELGFTLPEAIDDSPPLFDGHADPEHRAACMAQIRAALNRAQPAVSAPILDQTLSTAHTL
jgi:hypothetical protein